MSNKEAKPILLLGAYGRGNAGDDVFLHSAIELFPDKKIYINSAHDELLPEIAKTRMTTISTISASDTLKKIKIFFQIKDIIYWGGDLWVELYGTKMPRQLLYKMFISNILFRATGKRIHYVGCGIGALNGFSLWLARSSARMAKNIALRENRSFKVLGIKRAVVLPDLAVALPYNKTTLHKKPQATQIFKIVISILESIPERETNFPRLINSIAELVNDLPADQFEITILPMHKAVDDPHDDVWASNELAKLINDKHEIKIIDDNSLENVIELLRNSNAVIGTRLHSNILATINGTACLGIAYRPKVKSFFSDNGIPEMCITLDELDKLKDSFWDLYNNYDAISEKYNKISADLLSKKSGYKKIADTI